MLTCSIKGCKECHSEIIGDRVITRQWFVATPEQWPALAELAINNDGAGEFHTRIVLCPRHRKEVFDEISMLRTMQNAVTNPRIRVI